MAQATSNVCPVEDIRGKAGVGSVLSLDAIGKQDQFLLGDYSFLNYATRQHSNFQQYQTSTYVPPVPGVPNWPFNGATVLVTLYPKQMGDLLTGMYLKCTMPMLQDVGNPPQFPGPYYLSSRYCENVGRAIISSVKFRVDQYEIETIYDDWLHMYDDLYLTIDQKRATLDMTAGIGNQRYGPLDLYIPLNFFFSSKQASYFPLCAITNQKIILEIVFNQTNFFTNSRVDIPPFTLSLPSFEIICEQIVVSDAERLLFQVPNFKMLARVSQKQPEIQTNAGDAFLKAPLVMNIPVDNIHWALRQTLFQQPDVLGTTDYYLNRYNYSSTSNTNIIVQSLNPIMSDVTIFINNEDELGFFADATNNDIGRATYYRFAEPLKTNLSSPELNVYTYAFCLDGMNNDLSGAIDFSRVSAQTTFLQMNLLTQTASQAYTVEIFYVALKPLTFSGGFLSF